MKKFLRYVFWIAIAGGVLYGSYYVYDNWWNEGTSQKIGSGARELEQKTGRYATAIASSTKNAAGSFFKNKIGDFVSVVGEKIYSVGLNLSGVTSSPVIGNASSAVSGLPVGNVPAPTSSAFDVPPPPVTIIVVSVSETLSFSVNSGQTYKADWGDGKKEQGAIPAGDMTVLRHSWSGAGDYIVRVNVGNNISNNTYSFPVRVY